MSSIITLWKNTNDMPPILRVCCQGAMVAPPILALFLVLPLSDWQVNGRQVPYRELWSSGAGPVALLFVSLGAIGGWGLAARIGWSRWLWVAAPTAPLLMAAALPDTWFTQETTAAVSTWLVALASSALSYAELFWVPSVQRYLSGNVAPGA